jgi:hypothetical protein
MNLLVGFFKLCLPILKPSTVHPTLYHAYSTECPKVLPKLPNCMPSHKFGLVCIGSHRISTKSIHWYSWLEKKANHPSSHKFNRCFLHYFLWFFHNILLWIPIAKMLGPPLVHPPPPLDPSNYSGGAWTKIIRTQHFGNSWRTFNMVFDRQYYVVV